MSGSQNQDAIFSEVADILKRSISNRHNNDAETLEIKPESSLIDDLDLDSLTMVDVILDLEDHFQIKISKAESQSAFTANDLKELVIRKQQESRLLNTTK